MIVLDVLDPPTPQQLVADCHALGASGCAGYAWRPGGIGSWTVAHVRALRAAGLRYVPIIVPGDAPGPPGPMLDACAALGGPEPVVMVDTEPTSEPPAAWVQGQLLPAVHARGWVLEDYGPRAVIASHPADGEWLADWLRTGVLNPIPVLPPGLRAQQFVNDVPAPSGFRYDASVVAVNLFSGGAPVAFTNPVPFDQDDRNAIQDILGTASRADQDLHAGLGPGALAQFMVDVRAGLQQLLARPGATVDVAQLARDLAPLLPPGTDPNAVATAVLQRLGKAAQSA